MTDMTDSARHEPPEPGPDLAARSAAAVLLGPPGSAASPRAVYSKAADLAAYPASLAKLMTALLAMERREGDPAITVAAEDIRPGSGNYFAAGDTLSFVDALQALLIASSNTVAESLARTLGRPGDAGLTPRQEFVGAMNQRAAQLGMQQTTLTNPSGRQAAAMTTTAQDMLRLLMAVLDHPLLTDILGRRRARLTITGTRPRTHDIRTTVRELGSAAIVAGKTGTGPSSDEPVQRNLAAVASAPDGSRLAFVLIGAPSVPDRAADADALSRALLPGAEARGAGQREDALRDPETVRAVVGGSWFTPPAASWRLQRAVRPGTVLKDGSQTLPGTLVQLYESDDRGARLEASEADAANVVIIADSPSKVAESRFPVLLVDSVDDAMRALATYYAGEYRGSTIAITGSVGKTSTSAFVSAVLTGRSLTYWARGGNVNRAIRERCIRLGPQQHAIFEVSSAALPDASLLLRPDVAVVTAISEAHMADLGTLENVARVKAEIFSGLAPSGTAVLNLDAPYADLLLAQAHRHAGRVITYGRHAKADIRLLDYDDATSRVVASVHGEQRSYLLGAPGQHNALNSLAVLGVLCALGEDLDRYLPFVEQLSPVQGRGGQLEVTVAGRRVTVVDQTYNASPLAMTAALEDLRARFPDRRRVLVLGDMLELGEDEDRLHAELAGAVSRTEPDAVYLIGPLMTNLWTRLPASLRGAHVSAVAELHAALSTDLREGDVVLVKASNSVGLSELVARLTSE